MGKKKAIKANYTHAARRIAEGSVFGGIRANDPVSQFVTTRGGPLLRLATTMPLPKLRKSSKDFANEIKRTILPNTAFFLDTNFFTKQIDYVVWDALLSKTIIITPKVLRELEPWLREPFHNKSIRDYVLHAKDHGSTRIEFMELAPENHRLGFERYYSLLTYRKIKGVEVREAIETRLGRPPTKDEELKEWQKECTEMGLNLAKKGWQDRNKPIKFAAEELVVLAAQTAICRECDTVILTRDIDVHEQFIRLSHLLLSDYEAMLAADYHISHPDFFRFKELEVPDNDERSIGKLAKTTGMTMEFLEHIRPTNYVPRHIYFFYLEESLKNRG